MSLSPRRSLGFIVSPVPASYFAASQEEPATTLQRILLAFVAFEEVSGETVRQSLLGAFQGLGTSVRRRKY